MVVLLSPLILGIRAGHSLFRSTPATKCHKDSIETQLSRNWDTTHGGYRAGTAQYANVWTRDTFFAPCADSEHMQRLKCSASVFGARKQQGHIAFTFNQVITCQRYFPFLRIAEDGSSGGVLRRKVGTRGS